MEILTSSSTTIFFSKHPTQINLHKSSSSPHYYTFPISINTQKNKNNNKHLLNLSFSNSPLTRTNSTSTPTPSLSSSTSSSNLQHHWMVLMDPPPNGVHSKLEIINYYVKTLESVLPSEKDAQMCIYDASFDAHFGFCCDIDEHASRQLSRLPGVLSVKPDPNFESVKKDYTPVKIQTRTILNTNIGDNKNLFPAGSTKHWLVRMDKPTVGVVTKAQMVDHYVQILTKVMGNEMNAQMCIYHVSWQSDFGFCCELDEECADELTGVPGVLTVQLDNNFESEVKNYRGESIQSSAGPLDSSEASQDTIIKTKKLFITGLSFYTSEKTLRAAFEEFGEIVEVKIIMDKISKRSKGYAFIEYTTEEAAGAALKEMNNKIINGWMIVVDVAKVTPPKFSRGRPRPTF